MIMLKNRKIKARKRIAMFVGQADEAYQSKFIGGFLKNSFSADFDVCIFSMYRKYQDTVEREQGESNIFSLMEPSKFDGVIILKDSIQTENAADILEKRLKEVFDNPIVVIEKESDLFPSICTDSYTAEYELISHLIEVHNFRRIVFLSGKEWHEHSKERVQAFQDAMEDHGLTVNDDQIIYGDFWYQSGELCAEHLIASGEKLPDAVACANDQMAIGLCKAFEAHGVRVPQDVAVVGYDSTFEGQTSPKSLTSAMIPAEEFGEYAFWFLMSKMEGRIPSSFKVKPKLIFGESCGCDGSRMAEYRIKREEWGTDISEEGYDSVFNMMEENLLAQVSLQDYLNTVYSYVYQLKGIYSFDLCLGSDLKYWGQNIHLPNDGYPEQMMLAVKHSTDHRNNAANADQIFYTSEMVPELNAEREKPAAFFFTPVFYETECFGYAVVSYGDRPRSYDETYRRWISSVCRGLEVLRRALMFRQIQEHLERIRNNKFAASEYSFEALSDEEKAIYRLVTRILDSNLLDYHFQPIVSAVDGKVVAFEALMRSRTEQYVSPLTIIQYAAMQSRLYDVERATFKNVISILDRRSADFGDAKVFINSIPGVSVIEEDEKNFREAIKSHAKTVVVELTEEAEFKDDDLKRIKAFFNELNIETAVDDYGTGYSNVSNLLRYMPDYVKIDRSLLSGIQNQMQKQHFVREIIDFCHDNGIKALAEGVETVEELQTVVHLGVDLVQGYYTAKPAAEPALQIDEKIRNEIRRFCQERADGKTKKLHIAGKTSRISLMKLVKEGCTDIIVGGEGMVYKDVSVIGTPQMKTDIHLRVEAGYTGRITLEDVCFSNIRNRPCIELGENSEVTLVVSGINKLLNGGIKVPESSKLIVEGNGELNIDLNAPETFGIGNDLNSGNGGLVFDQDGPVNITNRGRSGVCIGSGLGGSISINRGEFNLKLKTETGVGIGAVSGNVSVSAFCCHIEADFAVSEGVVIGSLENDAEVYVEKSALRCFGSARSFSGVGTLRGRSVILRFSDSDTDFNLRGDRSTCFGALNGISDIRSDNISLTVVSFGKEALVFGGYDEDTTVNLADSDTRVTLNTDLEKDTFAPDGKFKIINGRHIYILNGCEQKRNVIIKI